MSTHDHEHSCCAHDREERKPWYKDFFLWIAVAAFCVSLLSYWIPIFDSFRHSFFMYLRMIAAPVILGFVLGGIVDHFVPQKYISKHLAGTKKRSVLYAAGLGFLMSACNHGILALSMELHKKGASGPAVVSFLLASPWANLPVTLLLIGFFGWKAIVLVVSAFLIALITGFIFQILDDQGWIEKNRHTVKIESGFSIRKDIAERFKIYQWSAKNLANDFRGVGRGMKSLASMTLSWIFLGVILASLSAAYIPPHLFHEFLGPSILGLTITIIASAILEVCSEGTSPLAFEIYKQTGAFGNAFAFLMGGVVTDYTEIGLLWKNIGPRTAMWMVAVTLPQVILLGWIFNLIF